MSGFKYYAIRLDKQMEIRVARERPKALLSTMTIKTEEEKRIRVVDSLDSWGVPKYHYETKKVPVKTKIEQTYWDGGRTLGFVGVYEFSNVCPDVPAEDKMVEISKALRLVLLPRSGA